MAKKTDVFNVASIDTVIGPGVRLKGNLSSEGDIAIDGVLAGNLHSGGHVTVGVNGQIQGNIKAEDSVNLMETGQLHGDIDTTQLEVGMGAIFIGTSKMKPAAATEISDSPETEPEA
jgi:cytoskeletal protein CcmA (bactofilin family)